MKEWCMYCNYYGQPPVVDGKCSRCGAPRPSKST